MSDRRNTITAIFGKKGSGKTTEARRRVRAADRRIIIDPMFEYTEGVIVESFDALAAYVRPLRLHRYAIVLRTLDDDDVHRTIELATAGSPEAPALPGVTLLIDEADRLCSAVSITEGMRRLFNYGRHFGVSVIAVARRPRAVHRDVTANADVIVIGQTQEPRDLDYLAEFVGEAGASRATELAPHEFVVWPDDLDASEPRRPVPREEEPTPAPSVVPEPASAAPEPIPAPEAASSAGGEGDAG